MLQTQSSILAIRIKLHALFDKQNIANYLTKESKLKKLDKLIVVANARRGWRGRGQKIGSRETIAFQRRDSVRNYNARGPNAMARDETAG